MSDRKWTNGTCFAYTYIFFACSDGDFADEEAATIFSKIKEWWPDADESLFVDACKTANGWLLDDWKNGGVDEVCSTACDLANWLNDYMNENMKDPNAAKAAFLKDLVAIAAADNKFMDSEKNYLELYAQALGLSLEFTE